MTFEPIPRRFEAYQLPEGALLYDVPEWVKDMDGAGDIFPLPSGRWGLVLKRDILTADPGDYLTWVQGVDGSHTVAHWKAAEFEAHFRKVDDGYRGAEAEDDGRTGGDGSSPEGQPEGAQDGGSPA